VQLCSAVQCRAVPWNAVSLTVIGEEAGDCHRLSDPTRNIGRGDFSLGVIEMLWKCWPWCCRIVLVVRNARRSAIGNRRQSSTGVNLRLLPICTSPCQGATRSLNLQGPRPLNLKQTSLFVVFLL
jgi:hypothetical protein